MNEDQIRALVLEAMAAAASEKPRASDYGDPDGKRFAIMTPASVLTVARQIGRAKGYDETKKATVIARTKRIAKRKGFALPKSWASNKESYVMSDQMRLDAIQAALNEERDPDCDGDDDTSYDSYERGYVRHVFADAGYFIFQMGWDGDWFKRTFTIDANGEAQLGAGATQVSPQLSFVPFAGMDGQESMASQAIAALDNRDSAVPFDKAYLQRAIDHHETAIHLATKASTEASDDKVKGLAKRIVKDHSPHLAEMKALHGADGTPAKTGESFSESGTVTEGFREVFEGHAIRETADDETGFHISGTAIMPGLNRSGNRVYPKETLSAAVPLFKGKKMYIDHPSVAEQRNRPERSFRDAGAVIEEAWLNASGGIDYRAAIIEPWLKEKLDLMSKVGALGSMGTSVHYGGMATPSTFEGRAVDNIDSIDVLNSLDFVTEPGAWGDIARLESAAGAVANDPIERNTAVDEETKKLIESMKAQIESLTTTVQESRAETQASDKARRISDTKATVVLALEKSELPEICRSRILAHYEGQESAEGIAKVIEDEKTLVKTLTEGYVKRNAPAAPQRRTGIVVGLGNTGARTAGAEGVGEGTEAHAPTDAEFADAMEGFIPNAAGFAKMMG